MKKILILLSLLAVACTSQTNTFVFEGNPLVRSCYTADPAPMVASDGRLYLFCGHDEQFDDKPGYEGKYPEVDAWPELCAEWLRTMGW